MSADRHILLRAAALIEGTARELRRAHTVPPRRKWSEEEIEAKLDYEDMLGIAAELRRIAGEPA